MSDFDSSTYSYENNSFYIVGSVAAVSLVFAAVFIILNMRHHFKSDYSHQLKLGVLICLADEIVIICFLALALIFYKIASVFLIIISILLSILVIFFYFYVQEILTMFIWKFFHNNPDMIKRYVKTKRRRKIMFDHDYPMEDVSIYSKIEIIDLYTKHAYYLQGKGKML